MAKRTRNLRRIKARHSYTLQEAAEILEKHPRTLQSWKKEGLLVIDPTSKPFLVMGQDLKDFIKGRTSKKKATLGPGEFYCLRCRMPRQSIPEKLVAEYTGRTLGHDTPQILIRGTCSVCGQRMLCLSSAKKLSELQKITALSQPQEGLKGSESSYLNTDIEGDRQNEG